MSNNEQTIDLDPKPYNNPISRLLLVAYLVEQEKAVGHYKQKTAHAQN